MTTKNEEDKKIEEEIIESEKIELEKTEKEINNIPVVAKYTRPPAFIAWKNSFKWGQNNFSKPIQRRASWRGR